MKLKSKKVVAVLMAFSVFMGMTGLNGFVKKAQADDVFQEVSVTTITRPGEVEDLIAEDKGLIFQMQDKGIGKQKFVVTERGWLILKCYFHGADYGWSTSAIFANATLSKQIGNPVDMHAYNKFYDYQGNYYVDEGTYYISHTVDRGTETAFLYFIPESSIAQSKVESTTNGTKISVSFTPDRASAKILNDKYSVDKINADAWKNATTMVDNSYTTTSVGDFTIKGEFASEEWKDFPVMLNVTVDKEAVNKPVATKEPTPTNKPENTNSSADDNKSSDASDSSDTSKQNDQTSTAEDNITDYSGDDEIEKITLKDESLTLTVGDEKKIGFSTEPEDTEPEDLEWISSNEDVAEVDDYGRITAVSAGKAKITVQTEDGEVSAVLKVVVNPQAASVTSVKSSKKKVTLKWERVDDISGYQVSYALKSSFKGAKNKNVAAKNTTVTLKNLKSKKYYYLRVRTYQTVSGKKYYSEWSQISKIKVK